MESIAKLTVEPKGETELVMKRQFAAPRADVFRAMVEPALLKQWLLGPPGWSMEVCDVDPRAGGGYRYVWRNERGTSMGVRGEFLEMTVPERIVQTEQFDQPWYEGPATGTLVLEERDGGTALSMTMRYASRETRDRILASGMASGVAISYDRLEALLEPALDS